MTQNKGVPASPSGYSAEPGPISVVPAVPVSIPNAVVVGFTGTQHHLNGNQKNVLTTILVGLRDIGAIWMHNGDCIESDDFAGRTWNSLGGAIHLHPPTNNSKRAFLDRLPMVVSSVPRPYLARNQDIADSVTVMVATPREMEEQPNGGTWYTIRAARQRELPIAIILPNGTIRYERWPAKLSGLCDTLMCDACDCSGFGVADTYCGKCGGAGGYSASAIEARRAETHSGSVHESAGPKDDAQQVQP